MKPKPQVRVGVGVFVHKRGEDGRTRFLLGKRKGSHGAGEWSLPGGHLEFNETLEACAIREVKEEVGIQVQRLYRLDAITNDIFRKEGKHYITIYMGCDYVSGEVKIMEPDKCTEWGWFTWDSLPKPLFTPIRNLKKHLGY